MSTLVDGEDLLHTDDYQNHFDTTSYLRESYAGIDIDPNEAPAAAFFIENTIRILKKGGKRSENSKALEFGGGPCLWPSFLLAQYVDSIRFSDYTQCNLDAVQDWIEQKLTAFDWTVYFHDILDVYGSSKAEISQWESRLRDALTRGGLSRCDVNDPHCPILSRPANEYDIIISSLCLEAACLTIESFHETIERLVRLLKPGGLLLLLMVRGESFYYVNEKKFFCLLLNETKVRESLDRTNVLSEISIINSDTNIDDQQRNTVSDFQGTMVICAQKRID